MPESPTCCPSQNKEPGSPCQPSTSRPELPACMNRRYQLLDQIITELDTEQKAANTKEGVGVKLMCDFWNILKDNPDCNLTQEIQKRMCGEADDATPVEHHVSSARQLTYVVGSKTQPKPKKRSPVYDGRLPASVADELLPLSKVLCNLEEAADFDMKCNAKINSLMQTQTQLKDQITHLEHREKEGVQMLKQADTMWTTMESQYKKKLAESQRRQNLLLKELKNLDNNTQKWRKNQRDLEFELKNLDKVKHEIKNKANQKMSDIKCLDLEIEDLKKRIEGCTKEMESYMNSTDKKKNASDARVKDIESQISKVKNMIDEAMLDKNEKEKETVRVVHEARTDLQNACKALLQKKLENEDLDAERKALQLEIDALKKTYESCTDRCQRKESSINHEIAKVTKEIDKCHGKCVQCHEVTDTSDVRKLCTDCPRCRKEFECSFESDHCCEDREQDCICMSVKQKFLDNVFENMYTLLERKIRTKAGKGLADAVAKCLSTSRNGKIDEKTRKILQEFILTVVKNNLDLTVIGGAVKTRCEMDQDTYDQLMLCLKDIQVSKPSTKDKNMRTRKDPCGRWGGSNECNCPRGPKNCVCLKRAPPPPNPCSSNRKDTCKMCPYHINMPCGPECAEMESLRAKPCESNHCTFAKNMRAAQCVLGPDKLNTHYAHRATRADFDSFGTCTYCGLSMSECSCPKDRGHPRLRIVEEVMGRYNDNEPSPIQKVDNACEIGDLSAHKMDPSRNDDKFCDCHLVPPKNLLDADDDCYCACLCPPEFQYYDY